MEQLKVGDWVHCRCKPGCRFIGVVVETRYDIHVRVHGRPKHTTRWCSTLLRTSKVGRYRATRKQKAEHIALLLTGEIT